jgi:hypothetical protein
MNHSIQPYEHFVHEPVPAEPPSSATKFACELGTELAAPQTDCLVADDYSFGRQ